MENQREKIIQAIKEGYSLKGIRLRCGNPSKKIINDIIKEVDPYMYSILSDTTLLKRYRDKLHNKYINFEEE